MINQVEGGPTCPISNKTSTGIKKHGAGRREILTMGKNGCQTMFIPTKWQYTCEYYHGACIGT